MLKKVDRNLWPPKRESERRRENEIEGESERVKESLFMVLQSNKCDVF